MSNADDEASEGESSLADGLADFATDPEDGEPSIGPSPPAVEIPTVPDPAPETGAADSDVDPEVQRVFWRLVLVFDVALLALALGPMFVYFEGDWNLGLPLFGLGAVTFVYGVEQYRRYQSDDSTD